MTTTAHAAASLRLTRLLGYLDADPGNLSLLHEAACAAYQIQDYATCESLLARCEADQPLPYELLSLRGLCALSQGRFDEAARMFESLHAEHADVTATYHLAYAKAMQGLFQHTIALLDDAVIATMPEAIPLKMRALHHLGRLEDVIALGKTYAEHPIAGAVIRGRLATALFDADDLEGARHYAALATDTAEGDTVSGMLALDASRDEEAMDFFRRALERDPHSSRARLGEGLGWLAAAQFAAAAQSLDHAAAQLKTHAGSWAAAGWAHLLNHDLDHARTCFEQATTVDRGFSEASGGLAMVCFCENRHDEAAHYAEVALRLDRACLSGAYVQSLLLAHSGRTTEARSMHEAALQQPIGPEGKTIAEALTRRAAKLRRQ